MAEEDWPKWKPFLEDYGHICKNVDDWQRTVFTIPLVGDVAKLPARKDSALVLYSSRGMVGRIDSLLYVWHLMKDSSLSFYQKKLMLYTVVELAGTDFGLAERLSRKSIEAISDPLPILLDMAAERDWLKLASQPANWASGTLDLFEGKDYENSIYLAAGNKLRELSKRLWRAQLTVIFPLIEEKRIGYIEKFIGKFPLPWRNGNDYINDAYELEISHLYSMANGNLINMEKSSINILRKLRDVRNALAHMETVPQEYLNDTMLFK